MHPSWLCTQIGGAMGSFVTLAQEAKNWTSLAKNIIFLHPNTFRTLELRKGTGLPAMMTASCSSFVPLPASHMFHPQIPIYSTIIECLIEDGKM